MSDLGSSRRRLPLLLIGGILLVVLGVAAVFLLADGDEAPAERTTSGDPTRTAAVEPAGGVVCPADDALPYLQAFNAQMPELRSRARAVSGDESRESIELEMLRTVQLREKVVANKVPPCMEGVQREFLAAVDAVIEGYDQLSDGDAGNDDEGQAALLKASDQLSDLERELAAITIEE